MELTRYGPAHSRLRKFMKPSVAAGLATCAYCHEPILPGEPWDLGHSDHNPGEYNGPEHQRCNRATAKRRLRHSREW